MEFTIGEVDYLLVLVVSYYSIHIFFGKDSIANVFKLYAQKTSLVYEHCLAQTGGVNINIDVHFDKKKGREGSFIIKKSEHLFHFGIPGSKDKDLEAFDILRTVKKLPIFRPEMENKKDAVPKQAYTSEYTYYVVFSSGVSICSLITYEQLLFVRFPVNEEFVWGKMHQRTNQITVYLKTCHFDLSIVNELGEIEGQFFEIQSFKGAFKAAKKHQLDFKPLVTNLLLF